MLRLLPDEQGIRKAVEALRNGGVVMHATETCYGLACDLRSPSAVEKLFRIKRRAHDQPVSALFASVEAAGSYVLWSREALVLAQKHLPGPLTIIVPLKQEAKLFPTPTGSPDGTIGVRVSPHPTAMSLARLAEIPLSTTSANLHGSPPLNSPEDLSSSFAGAEEMPDLFLDEGALPPSSPSTVIALRDGKISLVRQGGLRLE